ncbi:MAG: Flp family type IVb pilin [Alphaproteobacteria bacterium HGW-Alphaproteobacteria-11]|nr:MAG: Flp family type IVb pilin [Alphaproteobacteria bacterium HGW-Alphaproteobacteria-11]
MIGKLTGLTKSFAADESGATAIEYGIIAGGVSIAIAGAVALMSDTLRDDLFGVVAAAFA